MEAALGQRACLKNFGSLIAPLNAKYVVQFTASDYHSYGFLEEHNDLNVIFEGYNITLFRNLSHTARAYTVNLDDYLTTPSPQDPLGNLYVLGYGIKEAFSSGLAGSGKK